MVLGGLGGGVERVGWWCLVVVIFATGSYCSLRRSKKNILLCSNSKFRAYKPFMFFITITFITSSSSTTTKQLRHHHVLIYMIEGKTSQKKVVLEVKSLKICVLFSLKMYQ